MWGDLHFLVELPNNPTGLNYIIRGPLDEEFDGSPVEENTTRLDL